VKHYVAARYASELDGAGAADLVKGVEASICAAGAQAARRRLRRATQQVAVQGVVGVAEVRVVEDVEELGSKTKAHAVLAGN
jgi:hypothetical protein